MVAFVRALAGGAVPPLRYFQSRYAPLPAPAGYNPIQSVVVAVSLLMATVTTLPAWSESGSGGTVPFTDICACANAADVDESTPTARRMRTRRAVDISQPFRAHRQMRGAERKCG